MVIFNIQEAKTHFSKLLKRVMNGEEVIIARAGKPVAKITPLDENVSPPRIPGIDKGEIMIMPDFDTPISEFDP